MNSLREDLKVENTPVVGQNVKILMQCIEKEKELQKKWDEEDGIDITATDYKPEASVVMDCLDSFVKYRKSLIEFHYADLYTANAGAHNIVEIKHRYDSKRRTYHNSALSSLNILNRFLKQNGFTPFYTGETLTEEQIDDHNNFEAIDDMSNVILKLVSDLENYNGDFTSSSKTELTTIIDDIHHFNNQYKVIKPPITYNATTVFEDSKDRDLIVQ